MSADELFGLEVSSSFAQRHGEDNIPGAKFHVGEQVLYNGAHCTITGVNDSDGIEYSLENEAYLVWEEELEPIEEGGGD